MSIRSDEMPDETTAADETIPKVRFSDVRSSHARAMSFGRYLRTESPVRVLHRMRGAATGRRRKLSRQVTERITIVGGKHGDGIRVVGILRIWTEASPEGSAPPNVNANSRVQRTKLELAERFADDLGLEVVVIG